MAFIIPDLSYHLIHYCSQQRMYTEKVWNARRGDVPVFIPSIDGREVLRFESAHKVPRDYKPPIGMRIFVGGPDRCNEYQMIPVTATNKWGLIGADLAVQPEIVWGPCLWRLVRLGCFAWGTWGLLQDEYGWWVYPMPSPQRYGPFCQLRDALDHAEQIVGS